MGRQLLTALFCLTATASAFAQHRFELSLNATSSTEALSLSETHLKTPSRVEATHEAIRLIQQQLDEKEAAEARASVLEPIWKAGFWKYLPKSSARSMNSPMLDTTEDDTLFTPAYLHVADRQLQERVRLAEERARFLFSR